MMTRRLLIWTMALMFNTPVLIAGDEPDDPYQWLEEVAGAEALAWVKERNAESTGELTRSDSSGRSISGILGDPRLRRPDPGHPEGGPALLQLLARREEPARSLAADDNG